jgi:preprotein translocase subunit SecD
VIVTGDQITDAASGFDAQSGTPMVTVAAWTHPAAGACWT